MWHDIHQNACSVQTSHQRLTPRSRRGPTASHQARRPRWFILRPSGLASCRRSRLNSNVRRHEVAYAARSGRKLRETAESPRPPRLQGRPCGLYEDSNTVQSSRLSLRRADLVQRILSLISEVQAQDPRCHEPQAELEAATVLLPVASLSGPGVRWLSSAIRSTSQDQARAGAVRPSGEEAQVHGLSGAVPRTGVLGHSSFESGQGLQAAAVPPNPSFEARPNGKPPGPPAAVVYPTSVGPGVLPSVPPQLER